MERRSDEQVDGPGPGTNQQHESPCSTFFHVGWSRPRELTLTEAQNTTFWASIFENTIVCSVVAINCHSRDVTGEANLESTRLG